MKVKNKKSKIINLLPKEYIEARRVRQIQILIASVLVLEVVGFVTGIVVPQKMQSQEVSVQLEEVYAKLNDERYAEVNAKLLELETKQVEVEEWNQKYRELNKENFVSKRVLDSILTRVPEGVSISKVALSKAETGDSNCIVIEGFSADSMDVLNYCTLIEGTFGLGMAKNKVEYNKEENVYEYSIEIYIRDEVQQETSENIENTENEDNTDNIEGTEVVEGGDSQ